MEWSECQHAAIVGVMRQLNVIFKKRKDPLKGKVLEE